MKCIGHAFVGPTYIFSQAMKKDTTLLIDPTRSPHNQENFERKVFTILEEERTGDNCSHDGLHETNCFVIMMSIFHGSQLGFFFLSFLVFIFLFPRSR